MSMDRKASCQQLLVALRQKYCNTDDEIVDVCCREVPIGPDDIDVMELVYLVRLRNAGAEPLPMLEWDGLFVRYETPMSAKIESLAAVAVENDLCK